MTTRDVADTYVAALARTDADAAAIAGLPPAAVLPMLSPEAFDNRTGAARSARDALSHSDSRDDGALALVLGERLDAEIDLVDCGFTERLLAPLATPVDAVRSTFDQLPLDTDDEWAQVIESLLGVAPAHDDYFATLVRSAQRGHVVAARQVRQIAKRCRGWVQHDDFYGALSRRAPQAFRERPPPPAKPPRRRPYASPTRSSARCSPSPPRPTPSAATSTRTPPGRSSAATWTSPRPTPGGGASSTASRPRPMC